MPFIFDADQTAAEMETVIESHNQQPGDITFTNLSNIWWKFLTGPGQIGKDGKEKMGTPVCLSTGERRIQTFNMVVNRRFNEDKGYAFGLYNIGANSPAGVVSGGLFYKAWGVFLD